MSERSEFYTAGPAHPTQVRRVVPDFRPRGSASVISTNGRGPAQSVQRPAGSLTGVRDDSGAVHASVTPVAKPRLTLKQVWRARPRSLADVRADTISLIHMMWHKAKQLLAVSHRLIADAYQAARHPKRSVKRLLAASYRLTADGYQLATHPRRTLKRSVRFLAKHWPRIVKVAAAAALVIVVSTFLFHYFTRFNVAPNALSLLPKTSVDTKLIDQASGAVSYKASSDNSVKNKLVLADPTDATNGKNLYEASLGLDPSQGLTFGQTDTSSGQSAPSVPGLPTGGGQPDQNAKLSFKLVPLGGGVQQGKVTDSHVQYPSSAGQRFYTFRKNGVAEDIVLSKAPGDTATYQWRLDLPNSLEARMMPGGSVGIYSANPDLFGNIQVGDAKSQALLDKARKNGKKDTLAFVLPAPFIKTLNGKTNYQDAKFSLSGNILTLVASNLKKQSYPLSIDPTAVVNTTAGFRLGYDDGMIDYGNLNTNAITRNNISAGAVGSTTATNSFTTGRYGHTSVAYNGYVYVIGGATFASTTSCAIGASITWYCNDVQYAPFCTSASTPSGCPASNWQGAVGSFTTTNSFTTGRYGHTSVAYNGYVYVIGGATFASTTSCAIGASITWYCNDVQYAPFCTSASTPSGCPASNWQGALGSFTQQTNAFTSGRYNHSSVVYDGYVYIVGGNSMPNATGCGASPADCSDIQYCPLNANGSVGTCTQQTNAFTSARQSHSSVVYNGYLYIIGGSNGSDLNDIQYCHLNANGSVGDGISGNNECTQQTNAFTGIRNSQTSVVYNGYLYIIGGYNGSFQNDIQYCPINANGSTGTCTQQTNAFTTARDLHTSVVYNGYLYVIGGQNGSGQNDVQELQIQTMGSAGPAIQQKGIFTTARMSHGSAVYNGYIYIAAGTNGTKQKDIVHCPINGDGSIGTCVDQASILTTATQDPAVVAYNGFLYVIDGAETSTTSSDLEYCSLNASTGAITACTDHTNFEPSPDTLGTSSETAGVYNGNLIIIYGFGTQTYNNVEHCPILSTGDVGTCVVQAGVYTPNRYEHSTVIWNGYIYIIGGRTNSGNTATGCSATGGYCNDILYAQIKSDGSVCQPGSSFTVCSGTSVFTQQTNAFTTARFAHSSVVYNGYLFIIGGCSVANCTTYQNDIQYCPLNSNGSIGDGISGNLECTTTTSFTAARWNQASVVSNGFLYIIGGAKTTSDTTCAAVASIYCDDIQRMWVGQMGQPGTSTTNASGFTIGRNGQASVAYNGYLYIIGGQHAGSDTTCNTSSSAYCADIQFCQLSASTGAVSTCHYTHGGLDDGTSFVANAFGTARFTHAAVVYNGYLYIIAGYDGNFALSSIQYCPLDADGTVGTCNSTLGLRQGLQSPAAAAYNGYLYVTGGTTGSLQSTIEFCPINSGGTIGTCNYTHNSTNDGSTVTAGFTTARYAHTTVIYNGYLYIIGGNCGATICSDIQYCLINSDGTVAACTQELNAINPREFHTSAFYNGYLYIIDGQSGTASSIGCDASGICSDIQYCPVNSTGWVGACGEISSAFSLTRYEHSGALYNGYIYVAGGKNPSANSSDIQYTSVSSTDFIAPYERTLDLGYATAVIQSVVYTGVANCGVNIQYATAGSNGQFGSVSTIVAATSGATNTLNISNQRYIWLRMTMDDSTCGGQSNISNITVNYKVPPSVPTVIAPVNGATDVNSLTPSFQMSATQPQSDNLQYILKVCTNSFLTAGCQTADGTVSSAGWSAASYASGATATYTGISTLSWGTPYYWQVQACDATTTANGCTATGTQTFTTSFIPGAPTLTKPAASEANVSTTPELRFYSTDQDSDYLQYWIDICNNSSCTSIARSICQTNSGSNVPGTCASPSQTGWSSQSSQNGTAYPSGQTAIHTYQPAALTANTQYWWRAFAIDPGGSNTWSASSSIGTFTTIATPSSTSVHINGAVNLGGNVQVKP